MTRRFTWRWLPLALLMTAVIPTQAQPPTDAERTRSELANLMRSYPPRLPLVLRIDPSLLSNKPFLASYPDLEKLLTDHPEVVRDPSFYFGEPFDPRRSSVGREAVRAVFVFGAIAIALGLAVWLIRTLMDHRRWTSLNSLQTEVHSRILDRLSGNEELLAYLQSPAGSKFLESAPVGPDAVPRGAGAPMNRIIWTIQAGIVLAAGGGGFLFVSSGAPDDIATLLHAMGILAIALGAGFVISAIISFVISHRFGLIQMPAGKGE